MQMILDLQKLEVDATEYNALLTSCSSSAITCC
jgi:hypothetical protein